MVMQTLQASKEIAFKITMKFEGTGFNRLEGNFDGQGFTFGALGFCLGQGSLQTLIKQMYAADAARFHKCCNVYVPAYKEHRDISGNLLGMLAMSEERAVQWSLQRQRHVDTDDDGKPDQWQIEQQWLDAFERLGNQKIFQEVQRAQAESRFKRALEYGQRYDLKTVRGLAFFFDMCVQQGSIKSPTANKIRPRLERKDYPPADRFAIIAEYMAEQAIDEWAADTFARRMAIAEGEGKVHGKTWKLDRDFGLSDHQIVGWV